MQSTRRALLGVGAGLVGSLAGCLDGGSGVSYPDAGTDQRTAGAGGETDRDSEATDAEAAPRPPNRALARRTRLVADELAWFARTYPTAIETYRTAMADGETAVRDLRSRDSFGAADVDALATTLSAVQARVEDAVGGHFRVPGVVADRNRYHLRTTRKFTSRGDVDRAKEELLRLAKAYQKRASEEFIDKSLSRNPIHNRLFARVCPRPPNEDDQNDPPPDPWFLAELRHEPTEFRAYPHRGREWTDWPLLGEAWSSADDRRRLFDPLRRPEGRTDAAWILPHVVDPRQWSEPQYPENPDDPALFVQRYPDHEAAATARQSLLEGTVTAEGTYPFGSAAEAVDWTRVYYPHPGEADVAYAFLVQAGEFLLAAAVSEVSWTERIDWAGPLRRSWVWRP